VRVLIDACVDPRVAELLSAHEVRTAHQLGWQGLKDHILLSRLQGHFDVLVTIDRGIEFEHNLGKLRFGIVVFHVKKNKIEFYRPLAAALLEAIDRLAPGEVIHIHSDRG
jgi:hypothetical protein